MRKQSFLFHFYWITFGLSEKLIVDYLNMQNLNFVPFWLPFSHRLRLPAYANVAANISLVMSPSRPTWIIHSCWTLLVSIPTFTSSAAADEVTERWDVSWLQSDVLHLPMQSKQIKEKSDRKTRKGRVWTKITKARVREEGKTAIWERDVIRWGQQTKDMFVIRRR